MFLISLRWIIRLRSIKDLLATRKKIEYGFQMVYMYVYRKAEQKQFGAVLVPVKYKFIPFDIANTHSHMATNNTRDTWFMHVCTHAKFG